MSFLSTITPWDPRRGPRIRRATLLRIVMVMGASQQDGGSSYDLPENL